VRYLLQGELTIGPLGRAHQFAGVVSEKGFGTTTSVAFTKGAFVGLSVEGAIVGARSKVNDQFYGKPVESKDILSGKVEVPAEKVTLLSEVYDKLEKLGSGATAEAVAAEQAKKVAAAAVAEETAEEVKKTEDVVEVDAKAEAAKEDK